MLTDTKLKKLKGKKYAYRIFDKTLGDPGFGVRVTPNGHVSFFQMYQMDGKRRFMNLGSFSDWTLAEARGSARDARKQLDRSEDPQDNRDEAKVAKAEEKARKKSRGTVDSLFDSYIEWLELQGKRSASQVRRFKKAYISPVIGGFYVADLEPDDIRAVLRPIIRRNKFVLANRVRAYLVAALNFAISWKDKPNYTSKIRFDVVMNPAQVVDKPLKSEAPGERVLEEKEIKVLWKKWELGFPGEVLRLILASGGQRVEEALRAEWSEFDFQKYLWTLPANRTKSNRVHVVPITSLMAEELSKIKARRTQEAEESEAKDGISAFLFPGKVELGPYRTDSLGQALRRFCVDYKAESFTATDLRRTVKTQMGLLGVSKEIRDRLQGHAMSDVSSKHIDRYDYLVEKREAIEAWESYLRRIVSGEKNTVVQLSKRA
ncbi:MAG: integrase arm-type DNA-binding domain-containing protein [Xanthomonadales bacterium]|nr:integrase arm-type DNA-binding domain-containing protein [Xanthomonadales bacterium]